MAVKESKNPRSSLVIDNLKLRLHLGVTAKERAKKQAALITAKIDFANLPLACETGDISDTLCYDTLVQKIKKFCHKKEFTLIENLGMQLFTLIKKYLTRGDKLSLRLAKQYPLPDLPQSIFELND